MTCDDHPEQNESAADALAAYFRLLAADARADEHGAAGGAVLDPWTARIEQARSCIELLGRVWPDRAAGHTPSSVEASAGSAAGADGLPVRIGKFELLRELGRGTHGVVLLARDTTLERLVALKLPQPEVLVSVDLRDRFLREARAASQLAHPNLVSVLEADESGPICYIAQEYCPGPTLAEWLHERAEPVPPALAARVVLSLAAAVEYAHRRGIVHRDLKPSNVILDARVTEGAERGAARDRLWFIPKVADFGTAKLSGHDGDATRSGALLGTPLYMSPEQAAGRTADVGPPSDLYSLGVILYELLTLQPPFRGETPLDTLRRAATEEPAPPRRLRRAVPADLEAVCLKCLEKDPRRRYVSAAALAEDLERYLAGVPTIARPLGLLTRSWKWSRRQPAAAALAAVSSLAVLALVGGAAWHAATLQAALNVAEAQRREAQDFAAVARAREREVRQYLYAADMKLADKAWRQSHVAQTVALLGRYATDSGPEDLRTFAWRRLRSLCRGDALELVGHEGDVYCARFSPDGKALATAGRDGAARLWDTASGQQVAQFRGHAGELSSVCFSPDGRVLATGGDDDVVRLWDRSNGSEIAALAGHTGDMFVVAFSPDGKLLASGAKDRLVKLWDVDTRRERVTLAGHTGGIESLAFSPDGLSLATASGDHDAKLWSVIDAQEVATLHGHEGVVLAVAFSPDGQTLASGSEDRTVKLWDVATGRCLQSLGPHDEIVQSVAFSPDGNLLAAAVKDGTVELWDAKSGKRTATLQGHAGRIWYVAFAADGRLATASGDGSVRIWSRADHHDRKQLAVVPGHLVSLSFAPNDRRLFAAFVDAPERGTSTDTIIKMWTLGAESSESSWNVQGLAVNVAFARQGRDLIVARRTPSTALHSQVPLLDVATGTLRSSPPLDELGRGRASLSAFAHASNGNYVAGGNDDGTINLGNLETRRNYRLRGHTDLITTLTFSRDGSLLVSGSIDHTVRLWNVANAAQRAVLRGHRGAVHVASFAPDARTLATAGADRTLIFWDVGAEAPVATLQAHDAAVRCLAYSPGGRTVVTGGADGIVKLWDARTFQEVAAWQAHPGAVRAVAFAPDGKLLASGGDTSDGRSEVILWPADERKP